MKKVLVALVLILTLGLFGCGSQKATEKVLKVGATPVPHAEILRQVQPILEKEGIKLEIIEFTDYVKPNIALAEKELDANYFQHVPYLEQFNKDRGLNLTWTVKVHFEPMGLYSKKVKSINEFKPGAKIGIPNDPTNGGRALALLEKAGLITLKPGLGIKATVKDITSKKVDVVELEAAQLPRSLDDLDGAVINGNYAQEAKLSPKDALIAEDANSEAAETFGNVLAVRKGDENREEIKKLSEALKSEEIKKFINEKYNGAVVPLN
ncbi:MetQ/NlpA family ABC transporter substrate-binding protein [Carboxydothermus pertinax]|uniref:Lipoprotein n=1 Tax=Carboxydothermus pertinax TaxID=870242 RepID=A0A1L8CWH8_9THEO|nr:MetQ/NlpA family ABC transporter substrate-binding protein [Carboxydothermus pertinax]GAV23241.1 ABC transporter substrate-binding protein [Carboxydothermus pertinax]